MDDNLQDILQSVGEKPARSRLEPYAELIDELRHRELTYRQIAGILTDKCQVRVPKSTLNDFVRARTRRQRNATRKLARRRSATIPAVSTSRPLQSSQRQSNDEVLQKIAALKARKPAVEPAPNDFHYDPDEPLRLINPVKRDSRD